MRGVQRTGLVGWHLFGAAHVRAVWGCGVSEPKTDKCMVQFTLTGSYARRWLDYLDSPEGQKTFLAITKQNRKAMKVLMEFIDDVRPE